MKNCKFCGKTEFKVLKQHERQCIKNPQRTSTSGISSKGHKGGNRYTKAERLGLPTPKAPPVSEETRRRISLSNKDKVLDVDHKLSISESMKKAHDEGRAWNIGKSRWNNKPSYPEEFFIKVIENEFTDKNYVREYSIGKFALDFAWIHKKLCIEIDGEQHQRFQEYRERDERKDKFLKDSGWKVLRIEWQKMYKDPKHWIQIAKDFVTIPQ